MRMWLPLDAPINQSLQYSYSTQREDANRLATARMETTRGPTYSMARTIVVSRGQTLFRTEGKGQGYGHRATCRPAPWSAYQSQHSIQSHDTWSMSLTGKFKISVWIEREPEAWEVRTEWEVLETSAGTQQNLNRGCRKVTSLTLPSFAQLPCDVMAGFTWLIKFLGNKLLYGQIPDPFPRCGIGSGHARLACDL